MLQLSVVVGVVVAGIVVVAMVLPEGVDVLLIYLAMMDAPTAVCSVSTAIRGMKR